MTEPLSEPRQAIAPDTPVESIALSRIADILHDQQLQFRIEATDDASGQILRTGFSNCVIAIQIRKDVLIVDSLGRGRIPVSSGSQLLTIINQWNAENFAPTLRFFETGEHFLAVSGVRELNVAEPISRNQLGAFLMASLNALLTAFGWIEHNYPQYVDWEEINRD